MTDAQLHGPEGDLYEALRAAGDVPGIVALARLRPEVLDDPFLAQVQQWIADAQAAGSANAAAGLGQRLSVLQELRRGRDREAALPPVGRALMAFIRAETEGDAAAVFEASREVLAGEEAARLLENSFRSDDEAGQQRIAARVALLRRLQQG